MQDPGEVWYKLLYKKYEPEYLRNVVIGFSTIMAILTVPLMICSFALAETANVGFNVILTAFMLAGWEVGSIWLMQRGPNPFTYGFFMGVSITMNMVTFLTAIYWGQLAQCDTDYDNELDQFTCTHTGFMSGVCAFSVLIWLVQLPFLAVVISQREIIARNPADVDNQYGMNNSVSSLRFSYSRSMSESYHSNPSRYEKSGGGMPPPVYDL